MRQFSVSSLTVWLVNNKIVESMYECEDAYQMQGKMQIDDACIGVERSFGNDGRGSENKIPFLAVVSIDEAGHPLHVQLATLKTFSFAAIADWSQIDISRDCEVISDGLACFRAVAEVGCVPQPKSKMGGLQITRQNFDG